MAENMVKNKLLRIIPKKTLIETEINPRTFEKKWKELKKERDKHKRFKAKKMTKEDRIDENLNWILFTAKVN